MANDLVDDMLDRLETGWPVDRGVPVVRAEVERLRAALTKILDVVDWHEVTSIAYEALNGGDDG
jgi:hypothetical protein